MLGAPIYLHPADPVAPYPAIAGCDSLKHAMWEWGIETGTHALRLVFKGVFDLFPALLLAGYLLDRIFAPYIAMVFFLAPMIGIVLLLVPSRAVLAATGTVLVGIGLGAEVDLIAFLLSRYLGMRSFGEIYGYLFAIFMLGSGLGPFVMGVSFDRTGSYELIFVCFGFALALASTLMLRLGPMPIRSATELVRMLRYSRRPQPGK